MDNAVAKLEFNAETLQASGDLMGDPVEVSKLRREDFQFHEGRLEGDDVLQAVNKRSSQLDRGHQGPAAFLIMASGLDKVDDDNSHLCAPQSRFMIEEDIITFDKLLFNLSFI